MSPVPQRRQYTRHAVDLAVQVAVSGPHMKQVAPIAGHRIDGRLRDLSGGGARVVVSTFLPRATLVDVEMPALGSMAATRLPAQVMSVTMIDREPHYAIGLRFLDDQAAYVEQAIATGEAGKPVETGRRKSPLPDAGPDTPRWMAILLQAGLVDPDVLSKARVETGNDEEGVAEWLVANGCVTQRDLSLVRAQGWGLPFVDPSDYRANNANRKLVREEVARAHGLFPLFALERDITLVVGRPLDLGVLDQIRLETGCEVHSCIASPRELQHLIEWAYGGFLDSAGSRATPTAESIWGDVLKEVADTPVVKLVDVLLARAASSRASDVHIDAEENALRVRFRVDGVLREVPAPPKSLLPAMISRLKILSHMDIAETRKPQDGHFKFAAEHEELDVRVSTLPSTYGEAVVLRLLRSGARLLTLEELGMEPECLDRFDRLIHQPHGMLLVTGPTGSGKTTTLYSSLARLDRVRQSIITLEDPVEVRLPQVRQVSVNPRAGLTFQAGLRAILRQDPDCVMLGEIRDRETAEIALQAALTGHIVLSTLHTNSAAGATTRLLDMGVPDFLVASSLIGVLAQRLCRRLCPHCARPATGPLTDVEALAQELLGDTPHSEAVGCKRCGHTGYEGRVGVFELLVVSEPIRRAILARQDEQTIAALARRDGTVPLLEDGILKVRRGLTSVSEVLRVVGQLDGPARRRRRRRVEREADAEFDVAAYERLLARWLQPERAAVTAAEGRS